MRYLENMLNKELYYVSLIVFAGIFLQDFKLYSALSINTKLEVKSKTADVIQIVRNFTREVSESLLQVTNRKGWMCHKDCQDQKNLRKILTENRKEKKPQSVDSYPPTDLSAAIRPKLGLLIHKAKRRRKGNIMSLIIRKMFDVSPNRYITLTGVL